MAWSSPRIITSATATGALLAARTGATAFVIGERGLREALTSAGIRLVGELGALLEIDGPARELERALRGQYEAVRAARAGRPPRRVFCPLWRRPHMTLNRDT